MCEKCHDTGYLNGVENTTTQEVLKVDSALSPGEIARLYRYPQWVHIVQPCACKRDEQAAELMERTAANIPDDVKGHSLGHFIGLEHAQYAVDIAQAMIDGNEISIGGYTKPGVIFAGNAGAGKSSLAYILYTHYLHSGVSVGWLNFNDLVNQIRETYADSYRGQPLAGIVAPYGKPHVLVLDNFGSATRRDIMFEDAIEGMRLLLEPRYNRKLTTIVTTELSNKQIESQFGAMVSSRLMGGCHYAPMFGLDMRSKV